MQWSVLFSCPSRHSREDSKRTQHNIFAHFVDDTGMCGSCNATSHMATAQWFPSHELYTFVGTKVVWNLHGSPFEKERSAHTST